ncbi:HsdM family class I SAM-dependent methyltransferase [Pedobacter terrae]|uniref:HsdM family class I SAM-dependent methyltransferase n=1 Tax=Pedobacter terrae TaxID=405671 RepID=UPI002FF8BB42
MAKNEAEVLYIHEAIKIGIDAVLFRRFFRTEGDKPYRSEPAVCIFNRDDSFFDSAEHIRLHATLWSAGNNEIYIIKGQTKIFVINSRLPAEPNEKNELSVKSICLVNQALKDYDHARFAANLFNSGTFWEQRGFQEKLDANKSPYILLLDYLLKTRNGLLKSDSLHLTPAAIDKLLVTCILIKFLEERDDDEGKHTLKNIYEKYQIDNFSNALKDGLFLKVLADLSSEFNGKIFDKFTEEEKSSFLTTELSLLSGFLQGNLDVSTRQLFLWDQYNFKYLPAEVISAIYENFIQADAQRQSGKTEKGIVYTPIHLVNFLIDEVMPLDKSRELFADGIFKILDPACGSGVFLVAAYKRLLQWWIINNSRDGEIVYPTSVQALKILEDNIFGVDIKETATLVSIFGLTTALIDTLTPKELWNNLKFSDLSNRNIQSDSFFDWYLTNNLDHSSFDLVIGNPPFNPIAGLSKKDAVTDQQLAKFGIKNTTVPGNNFALKFFEGSLFLGKNVCMIIPAAVLLYSRSSAAYRTRLFTKFNVSRIFDFTHLRRDLFHKTADTPVVAIIAENKESERKAISHTVVKRMLASEKKIGFEIDSYDKHLVRWDWAVDEAKFFIWKANLLGGGRLFHFIYRLSLLPTLKDYIQKRAIENSEWIYSSGYKVGGNTEKTQYDFINQGKKIDAIDENGSYTVAVVGEKTDMLEYSPHERIYTPPMLVIDQRLGKKNIPLTYIDKFTSAKFAYFSRDFVGIHAPVEDSSYLVEVYSAIKQNYNQLYLFYTTVLSGSCLVLTETEINKRDLDMLPFPEEKSFLKMSKNEQLILDDVLNYQVQLGKAISKNAGGRIFEEAVTKSQLAKFGQLFCENLNESYARDGQKWQQGKIENNGTNIIYQFGFGPQQMLSENAASLAEVDLSAIVQDNQSNKGAVFTRITRIYQHINGFDCIFIIKPSKVRYWLNSIAIRDADETIVDLKKEGF